MKSLPLFSVVIPTLNSEKTLTKSLNSLLQQNYPKSKIEILVVDGGSKDKTLQIARKYNAKIIFNEKIDLIYAKHTGYLKAKGKYLIFLDSDESLKNKNSLLNRYKAYQDNKTIKATYPSGYQTEKGTHKINRYINEFGDPFSFFIYKQSKEDKRLITDLERNYKLIADNPLYVIFDYKNNSLPLMELWAGGCSIDLEYTKKKFPHIKEQPSLIAHLFYLITNDRKRVAIMKDDATIHISTASISKYLLKLKSRIKNNVFQTEMGLSGYLGRNSITHSNLRKYLFIPYALSLVLPLVDSIYLSKTHKDTSYLWHLPLTFYTAILILYFYTLKLLRINVQLKNYGN